MKYVSKFIPFIILIFALLTLFMSSSVIFDLFHIREKEGNYVPFIVWTNFACSFLYLIAAWGYFKSFYWTKHILSIAVFLLIAAFIALINHIYQGGLYESKTVKAMIFRVTLTLVFFLFSMKFIKQKLIS